MSIVEIDSVSKSLGNKHILNNLTWKIEENHAYALIGPNGAGKTTLIRILLGLYKVDSGTITYNINSKRDIGFMLHSTGLYSLLTCEENLELYAEIYGIENKKKKIDDLLQCIGLECNKNDKVYTLSKGMRQKLVLARALLHDPQLLILDEPTVGLEIETKIWFRKFVQKYVRERQKSIILSSHELTELEKTCTDIAILRKGSLIRTDLVSELNKPLEDIYLESSDINESMY